MRGLGCKPFAKHVCAGHTQQPRSEHTCPAREKSPANLLPEEKIVPGYPRVTGEVPWKSHSRGHRKLPSGDEVSLERPFFASEALRGVEEEAECARLRLFCLQWSPACPSESEKEAGPAATFHQTPDGVSVPGLRGGVGVRSQEPQGPQALSKCFMLVSLLLWGL